MFYNGNPTALGADWKSYFAQLEELFRVKFKNELDDEWQELYRRDSEEYDISFRLLFNESESIFKMDAWLSTDGTSFDVQVWWDEINDKESAINMAEAKWKRLIREVKRDREKTLGQ